MMGMPELPRLLQCELVEILRYNVRIGEFQNFSQTFDNTAIFRAKSKKTAKTDLCRKNFATPPAVLAAFSEFRRQVKPSCFYHGINSRAALLS